MSLGDALSIAMAGLRANQASMSLVSSNVANAETPGYIRKTIDQVVTNNGQTGTGVQRMSLGQQFRQGVVHGKHCRSIHFALISAPRGAGGAL